MIDISIILFYLLALLFVGFILFFSLGHAVFEVVAFVYYLFFRKEEKKPESGDYSIEQGDEVK